MITHREPWPAKRIRRDRRPGTAPRTSRRWTRPAGIPRKGHSGRFYIRNGDLGESGAVLTGSFHVGRGSGVATARLALMGCGHKIRFTQMGYGHKLLERDARMSAVIESLDAVHPRLSDDALRRLTDAGALTVI